jgi:hypothetical protein
VAGKSDFLENRFIDAFLRGGCMTTGGAAGLSTVVKGLWTASTAYAVGEIVVPHANMTGAGGKLLRCVIAQNSGSTNTLAIGNPGSTVTDNGAAMWEVLSTMPVYQNFHFALLTAAPSDSGGGTEVSGGSYARVSYACTAANWAGTQSAGSTTASSGTGGVTSNNNAITFPSPTANWGTVTHVGVYDNATTGNLLWWVALSQSKTVNNGDAAPSFGAAAFTITED